MKASYYIIRVVLLAAILFISQMLYKELWWESDLKEHADILENLQLVQDSVDAIYFAESSNFTTSKTDNDLRSISEMLDDSIPTLKVGTVEKGAQHARIYHSLIKRIPDDSPVKMVIVTMNLRSFSADWIHSELESNLMKSDLLLQDRPELLNRFLLTLNFYDNKRGAERLRDLHQVWKDDKINWPFDFPYDNIYDWDVAMGNGGWLNEDGSWDMPKIQLGTQQIKQFGFDIKEDNPRIQDFDGIVKTCNEKSLMLVFNILAENIDAVDSLVGEELVFLMKRNRDFLMERYQGQNVLVVDNLELVRDASFTDRDFPTEHYDQRGRMDVAMNLRDSISEILQLRK